MTLVTFAEKDGMRLICVVFRSPDDSTRYIDTRALLTGDLVTLRNQLLLIHR